MTYNHSIFHLLYKYSERRAARQIKSAVFGPPAGKTPQEETRKGSRPEAHRGIGTEGARRGKATAGTDRIAGWRRTGTDRRAEMEEPTASQGGDGRERNGRTGNEEPAGSEQPDGQNGGRRHPHTG